MNKLKSLEIRKLLKELDYIESEFEYTNEVISDADTSFMEGINFTLDKYPELKDKYNEKLDEVIKKSIESKSKSNDVDDNQEVSEEENTTKKTDKSTKIKKLYREIVKLTHPDKVDDEDLNDIYLKSTEYYDDDNTIGIYKICDSLNIEYELEEDDNLKISETINKLKGKISFLESTFTWVWYNAKSDEEKEQIILNFIKNKIN